MRKISLKINENDTLKGNAWEIDNPIANVVIMQGMEEYGARYDGLAKYLNSKKINVYALDCYGQGENVLPDLSNASHWPHDGFAKQVIAHDKMVEEAKKNGAKTFIFAHSMGSYMCQDYIQRFPDHVEKVIMCGSGCKNPAVRIAHRVSKRFIKEKNRYQKSRILNKLMFGNFNAKIKNPKTNFDWLSRNSENVEKYIADPLCGFGPTNGFCLEFLEGMRHLYSRKGLERINKDLKIFLITGAEDPVSSYGAATKNLVKMYKGLGVNKVSSKVYPKGRHEILFEDFKEEVYQDIYNFFID